MLDKKEVLKLAAKQTGRVVTPEEGAMFLDQLDTNTVKHPLNHSSEPLVCALGYNDHSLVHWCAPQDGKISLDEYIRYVVGGEYSIRAGPAQDTELGGIQEPRPYPLLLF